MKKRLATGYTFTAAAKTVTHADFSDITLAGIQLIVNVTDQIIIYNFADTTKGGTLATDTLTLEYDTTSMSDTDELMILVEDGVATQGVTASSLPLPTGASTSANQSTIIGHVDGIETLLGTIDADTGNISTKIDTIAGAVSGTEVQVDVLTMPTTTVQATNLDIRDLTQTSDAVAIYGSDDGGTTKRIIKTDAGGAIQVDLEVASVAVTSIAAGDNNIGNVDVVSSALPTGASTLAEQQSQTTHLATIAGDTTAIEAAVQLLDDTVATDGAATPTKGILMAGQDGTNAQTIRTDSDGYLQVDVLTMPSTTVTATDLDIRNLTATDVVTAELSATDNAVLDAIAASVAAIDTDATTIIGHVDGIETVLGTIDTDTGNIVTSVQLLDDTVATLGTDTYTEAATKGLIISAVRRDADTTLVNTTNEIGPLQMNAAGQLKVEVFSGEALPVTMTSTTITGTVAVTQSGTWDEVGINDSGNSITIDNSTLAVVGGGTEATAMRVTIASDSTGVLSIDDNGASLTVDGTVTANLSATDNAILDSIDVSTASKYITGIGHGVTTVTTAGTDVVLAASTACKKIIIQAQTDNTSIIAVGGSGVDATIATGTGIVLYPGDSIEIDIDNLNDVSIDSLVNGEGVRYTYFT